MNPGCIVQARNRYWVLLPHEDPNIYLLRPLTGATDAVVAIHKGLADRVGFELPPNVPNRRPSPRRGWRTSLMRSAPTCSGRQHA